MGSRYLTDLAAVCRRTGRPVIEVDGWQTRARGSGGYDAGRPTHVMVHHTASGPSSDGWPDVNYCTHGDEDAPLTNLYLSRDGTIYVCAAGATNTNGSGHDPCGVTADDSMNSSAVGIEAGNDGRGEPWPVPQQDAYVALCSELCGAYGIGVVQVHAHAEWAPDRKVDPAGSSRYASGSATWNMGAMRDDVAHAGGTPPPEPEPEPQPPEEDTVKLYLVAHPVTGAWFVTDYVTAKTYVPSPDVAAEGRDRFGWLTAADGGPFVLTGIPWADLLNSLPENRAPR